MYGEFKRKLINRMNHYEFNDFEKEVVLNDFDFLFERYRLILRKKKNGQKVDDRQDENL